ncbi:MAG TPA: tetratricopeptide repeat protein [Balneolaceae bacterium]|nr:tetratricopeptide repeat protein [Balneolaceae bacterium]
MNIKKLISELKRRNVFKVATAYAIAGWLIIQVVTSVFPAFKFPVWTTQFVIILVLIGFPISLIIAWAFELTPEGIKRSEELPAVPPSGRKIGKNLNYAIMIMLVLAVVMLAYKVFSGNNIKGESLHSGKIFTDSTAIPAKSVAVLPFVNMSHDSSDDYFSDGITEEILNALAQIPGLKVPGRTSSFVFKGKNENLSKVGRDLNVAYVLEGSIQRAGDEVRITAQLINSRTDYHIWSHYYDRKLKNVFAIEDEISKAIANELKLKLNVGNRQQEAISDPDVKAHDLYLLGLHYWNKRTPTDLRHAISYFKQAISHDSTYATAWAGLANAYAVPAAWYDTLEPSRALPLAEIAARNALKLDPKLAQAHTALAYTIMNYEHDWTTARTEFDKALKYDPTYPTAYEFLAEWYATQGETNKAVQTAKHAVELDPLSMIIGWDLGRQLIFDRKYTEAKKQFKKVLKLHPHSLQNYESLIRIFVLEGDSAAAMNEVRKSLKIFNRPDSVWTNIKDSVKKYGIDRLDITARFVHDKKSFYTNANQMIDTKNLGYLATDLVASPEMDPLREKSGYKNILKRLNLEEAGKRMMQYIQSLN